MPRISHLLWATALIFTGSASVSGMPSQASSTPDISFSVFFDPGTAALSKEGQEIISVAAKRFVATHSRHSAARLLLTCETDNRESASLSNERINAVGQQLARHGIQRKYVSTVGPPNIQADPPSLRESQHRRVSISIHVNSAIARL